MGCCEVTLGDVTFKWLGPPSPVAAPPGGEEPASPRELQAYLDRLANGDDDEDLDDVLYHSSGG